MGLPSGNRSSSKERGVPLVIPAIGAQATLDDLRQHWGPLFCRLFQAPKSQLSTDDVASYASIEASFPGYASQEITNWQSPTLVGNVAFTVADLLRFVVSSSSSSSTWGSPGQLIYGYFVTDASGILRWAESQPESPGPIEVIDAGDAVAVAPRFSLESKY